jgi:hypothetical protein
MIKEFCKSNSIAIIRNNHYGNGMDVFEGLYLEALKDFPKLKRSDVRIVQYAGERYARTFGIEFPATSAPATYERIEQLEYFY